MYNVVTKTLTVAVVVMSLASCGDNEDKANAEALLAEITQLLDEGNALQAIEMMDTLNARYPDQVEARRQALNLRPRAVEAVTQTQIAAADSAIAVAQAEIARLEPLFKHVPSTTGLEGYYVVDKAYNPNFINANGIEARVNDADFRFYIVAQDNAKIGLNQVALFTASEQCESQPIPAGSARAFTEEGWEMASFLPEEVDPLGLWAANHPEIKGAMLLGNKGNKRVTLTPAQAESFGIAWRYADQKQRLRSALIIREKLERQLQTARDQAANI